MGVRLHTVYSVGKGKGKKARINLEQAMKNLRRSNGGWVVNATPPATSLPGQRHSTTVQEAGWAKAGPDGCGKSRSSHRYSITVPSSP
jgi:hypothetical protein